MTKKKLFAGLLIYIVFVCSIFAFSANHDQELYGNRYQVTSDTSSVSGSASSSYEYVDGKYVSADESVVQAKNLFFMFFILFSLIYLFRLGIFGLAVKSTDPRAWKKRAKFGVYGAAPLELLALILAIQLSLQQGCVEAGFTSSCGSGSIALSLVIGFAMIFQILGHVIAGKSLASQARQH